MGQPNFALKMPATNIGNTFANDIGILKGTLEGNVRKIIKKEDWLEPIENPTQDNREPIKLDIITTPTQEGSQQDIRISSKTISTPIAKWEGIVVSVDYDNGKFQGELRDILNYSATDAIIADFDFDDIEESKHNLIKEGSIFYWNIYDENRGQGKNRGINYIYFREVQVLPIWKSYNFNNISSDALTAHKAIFDDCSS